jgi:hypothetical protein
VARLIVVGVAALLALLPLSPAAVERWYSRGLYPAIQPVITGFSSIVPVALLDIAAAIALAGAAVSAARRVRSAGFQRWLRELPFALLVAAAVFYLWFLAFWGLNYRRLPLEQKLAYESSRVSRDQALSIGRIAVEQLNSLAPQVRAVEPNDDSLAAALREVEGMLGSKSNVRVAAPKYSVLTWYFRKAAIDGMTDPFFLEIIVTPDLLPFERPHTLAHEWAHLAGYADESEANFVAWLACVRGSPLARYSGWLAAYQHVAAVLPRDDRGTLRSGLSPTVLADFEAIRLRLSRASPRVSTAARGAYDTYLRANRVEEGIDSYGAVVRLMLGTTFGPGWVPQLGPPQ